MRFLLGEHGMRRLAHVAVAYPVRVTRSAEGEGPAGVRMATTRSALIERAPRNPPRPCASGQRYTAAVGSLS